MHYFQVNSVVAWIKKRIKMVAAAGESYIHFIHRRL
jgi:hypothetical protein